MPSSSSSFFLPSTHVILGFAALLVALSPVAVAAQTSQMAYVPGDGNARIEIVKVSPAPSSLTSFAVGSNPRAVAVTPDGQRVFVANYGGGGLVTMHDATTGQQLLSVPGTGAAQALAISPDGSELYASVSVGAQVVVISATTGAVLGAIPVGGNPSAIVFHPGGSHAFVSCQSTETVEVINTSTRTRDAIIPLAGAATGLAIQPDATKLYASLGFGTLSQRVQVIDVTTNTVSNTISLAGDVLTGVAISKDGDRLFVTSRNQSQVRVISLASETLSSSFAVPGFPSDIDVSRDGLRIYVLLSDTGVLAEYNASTYLQASPPIGLTALSSPGATGPFLGPNVITGTLAVSSDAQLVDGWPVSTPYVNIGGGMLQLGANWTSARTLSVLASGGTIDTNGFNAEIATVGAGTLIKTSAGILTLSSPRHTGMTDINGGGVLIDAGVTHSGEVAAEGGTLHGSGTVGALTVLPGGSVEPGGVDSGGSGTGQTGILTAASATFGAGSTLVVDLNSATAGSGHDRLEVTGSTTVTATATLNVRLGYTPVPGTTYVILQNVSGAFSGLPEGGKLVAGGHTFLVSYLGGDGNDMTLTANDPPTAGTIAAQSVLENRVLGPLSLAIADDGTPAASLIVNGVSSDHSVVLDSSAGGGGGIAISGTGSPRSITITPVDGASGQTTITLNVSDGVHTTPVSFVLTVTADDPPTLTNPGNQSTKRDTPLGPLSFTIGDDQTAISALTVDATSSNSSLVRTEDVVISGTTASRQVTITPQPLQMGQTTITLTVTDELSQTSQQTFTVDVTLDDLPTITGQPTASTPRDTVLGPLAFTIGDDVAAASALTFTAASSQQAVVPNGGIAIGGSGANRTLTITPAEHASGQTVITISVFDGLQTQTHALTVTVTMDDPPTLDGLVDQNLILGDPIAPLAFTIDDDLIPAATLTVTAASSNQALLRDADLVVSGSGQARTLTFTPVAEATGTAIVTLTVSDGLHTTPRAFTLTMTRDLPPTIDGPADQRTKRDMTIGPLAFTVGDDLRATSALDITVTSSDQSVVRDADLVLGGADAARTLTITPVAGVVGTATITLRAADERGATTQAFAVAFDEPSRTYYLAEGASGAFFDTDLLLANPQSVATPVEIAFLTASGGRVTLTRTLPPTSRTTIRVDEVDGLEEAEFATIVTSPTGAPIVVERTMWWDATGYGAHTEKASEEGPGLTWYFAEGAQSDFFRTYLLLANPNAEENRAHVTWLREREPALTIDYPLQPASRRTVDVSLHEELAGRVFGAIVRFDRPGLAERSMYFGTQPMFSGGHASAGAPAPATEWLLAEGATGSFFSTYVLLANPDSEPAKATVTFLPDTGVPVTREVTIGAFQRETLDVGVQDPTLAAAAVGAHVVSDRPIIVERSVYWPNTGWYEAHNSGGVTAPARHWGLAEGRVGGAAVQQTFVLLANPGTSPATVTLTFLREDGTTVTKEVTVGATSRTTVAIAGAGSDVPQLSDESFGVDIVSTQPIVVERSLYSSSNGVHWAAGTTATATRLP